VQNLISELVEMPQLREDVLNLVAFAFLPSLCIGYPINELHSAFDASAGKYGLCGRSRNASEVP
jgi:hypothetical protein